jgi:hypothetical protein
MAFEFINRLYLGIVLPSGQLVVVSNSGAPIAPFISNVTIADGTTILFSSFFPVEVPFGTYTFYMALVYAGADVTDLSNWASPLSRVVVSYNPLSPAQQAVIQSQGGNPDLLAVTWVDERHEKWESWVYLSGSPTIYSFLNGTSQGQGPASGFASGAAPKIDPSLFNPQTTLDTLTAAFGPPASVTPFTAAPNLQVVHYAIGLDVILRDGLLSSAITSIP